MKKAIVLLILLGLAAWGDPVVDWSLIPSPDVSGYAGDTVGWGYSIQNNSTLYYLAVDSVGQSSAFQIGTGSILINSVLDNMPILAPGASTSQLFDAVLQHGLMSLLIDSNAIPNAKDTGYFIVTFGFYSADPLSDPDAERMDEFIDQRPYSATVNESQPPPPIGITPEPGSWLLLAGALTILAGRRLRRQTAR